MWTTFLPYPQKHICNKQQITTAFRKKVFCAAAQKCFGYLHDGIVADSKMFFGAGANNH